MTSELHKIVEKSRSLAPSSQARYLRDLDVWIEWAGTDPLNWTRSAAQEFYDDFLLDERKLKPQSANRLFASIAYASKWWAHFQQRPELHFAEIQKTRGRRARDRHALERATITQLLTNMKPKVLDAHPPTMRDYGLIVLLLETGMRKMSACSMTIERTITTPERIAEAKAPYPLTWVRIKGSGLDDVAIPLSDTAIAALEPWRHWLAQCGKTSGPMFRAIPQQMGGSGLIYKIERTPLYPDFINRILDKRAAEAGIGHIHPHQFRHTFVTTRAQAGLLPHEIAAITAHTIPGLGAMGGYIDLTAIAQKVRNSTPEWLRDLVRE